MDTEISYEKGGVSYAEWDPEDEVEYYYKHTLPSAKPGGHSLIFLELNRLEDNRYVKEAEFAEYKCKDCGTILEYVVDAIETSHYYNKQGGWLEYPSCNEAMMDKAMK